VSVAGKIRGFFSSPTAVRFVGELFFTMEGMRAQGALKLKDLKNVLVVKLDEIGDAVMLTPFVRELRGGLPDAWITLVVKPELKELWETCPYVNDVVAFDRQTGFASLKSHRRAISFARKELWNRRFDMAIVPRWDADYYGASFLAYFSGARHRVGYSEKVTGTKGEQNRGYDRLFTLVSSYAGVKHESERNLDLLRGLGIKAERAKTELWLNKEDIAFAEAALVKGSALKVALGIGATSGKRVWPLENFRELAHRLSRERGATVIVLGGEKERLAGEALCRDMGDSVINLAGRTTLRQAAAVLEKADVYIGNDSGLMHVAAAVGTPVVEISCHPANGDAGHYNSPSRFGPCGVCQVILQPERAVSPCIDACVAERAHCIEKISVDAAQKALKDLLG